MDTQVIKEEIHETEVKVEKSEPKDEEIKPEVKDIKSKVEQIKPKDDESEPKDEKTGDNKLDSKIIRQIEYYFCDFNLTKDKFMQNAIKEATNGWIKLDLLMTFNRLKTLTTDSEVVIKALKKSESGLLEIDEDNKQLRRDPNKPLPEKIQSVKDEETFRTLYMKGFPLDSTLDQLLEYFSGFGCDVNIVMRRNYQKKTFKGSIFACFETKEMAEEFFAKDEPLTFQGNTLVKETKSEYTKRKEVEFENRKKEREQRKNERKTKKSNPDGDDEKPEKEEEKNGNGFDAENIEKGCLLKLTGLSDKVSWEDIKNVFKQHAEIAYVEYSRGDPEAIIRFQEGGSAALALTRATEAAPDNKLTMLDKEISGSVVEGDDEVAFWRSLWEQKNNRKRHNHKGFRGGHRGRGARGGRGRGNFDRRGGRGHKRSANDSRQSDSKKAKTETS